MFRYIRGIIGSLIFLLACNYCVEAAGLSTGFSEVTLENLEIGKAYRTKELAGLPLIIVNTGEQAIDLKIELLLPQPLELKDGYDSIPDLGWIKLEQAEFTEIRPDSSAITDVIISIPDEKKYQGKNYQVFIWSHTVGTKIGLGLKSKLLFTIRNVKDRK